MAVAWTCSLAPGGGNSNLVRSLAAPAAAGGEYVAARAHGAALLRASAYDEAVKVLEAAAASRPQPSPSVWLLLALAHAKLGDRDSASDYYEQVRPWPAKAGTEPLERRSLRIEVKAALKPPG